MGGRDELRGSRTPFPQRNPRMLHQGRFFGAIKVHHFSIYTDDPFYFLAPLLVCATYFSTPQRQPTNAVFMRGINVNGSNTYHIVSIWANNTSACALPFFPLPNPYFAIQLANPEVASAIRRFISMICIISSI